MELTKEEADTLVAVLQNALEELEDAKELMIEDGSTFETVEEFSETMQFNQGMMDDVVSIQKKVRDEYGD
jgi:uncharacterized protein (DUF2164 family)